MITLRKLLNISIPSVGFGCEIKANSLHVEPEPMGRVPFVCGRVFLRNPSLYLREFQRKPQKTPSSLVTNTTENQTWHLLSTVLRAKPLDHWRGSFVGNEK